MNISVLVLESSIALPAIGSLEILAKSGRMAIELGEVAGPNNPFVPELVGVGSRTVRSVDGIPVACHRTIDEVDETDLVLVPALEGDVLYHLDANSAAVSWLKKMYARGTEIASICTGAFLIAEAGLLTHKRATTHWIAQDIFASRYPDVELLPQNIIVDEGRIITSGGATTFLNLLMYLVEKYCGHETARFASKVFLIDVHRGPQTSFAIFSTQKNHGDSLVRRVQDMIEADHTEDLSIERISEQFASSRRNLERRFKAATGNTLIEYVQRVRVESAKKALESTTATVTEISGRVGYDDVPSFRKLFSRVTGLSPSRYRQRYAFVDSPKRSDNRSTETE